jgi:hypothetical protein
MPLTFTPANQQQVDFMQNMLLTYVNEGIHADTERVLAQATLAALQGGWPLTLTRQQDEFLQQILLDYQEEHPFAGDVTNQLLTQCMTLISG